MSPQPSFDTGPGTRLGSVGPGWGWVFFVARWLAGAVLLYAGLSKVFSSVGGNWGVDELANLLRTQGVTPGEWSQGISVAVVAAEVVIGAALVKPAAPRWAGWCGAALLAAFSVYLVLVYRRQGVVQCACFGRIQRGELPWMLARNGALMLCAGAWVMWRERARGVGAALAGVPGSPMVGG